MQTDKLIEATKKVQEQLGVTVDGVWGSQSQAALENTLKQGKTIYLSKDITVNEVVHSNTAVRHGIYNMPTKEHFLHMIEACTFLWQPARDELGVALMISSGYRNPKVNSLVGGSSTSAHPLGFAIDSTSPKFGSPREIANFLFKRFKEKGIKFDQIILEFPDSPSQWVHLGYKNQYGQQREQPLTAKKINGRTKYLQGFV